MEKENDTMDSKPENSTYLAQTPKNTITLNMSGSTKSSFVKDEKYEFNAPKYYDFEAGTPSTNVDSWFDNLEDTPCNNKTATPFMDSQKKFTIFTPPPVREMKNFKKINKEKESIVENNNNNENKNIEKETIKNQTIEKENIENETIENDTIEIENIKYEKLKREKGKEKEKDNIEIIKVFEDNRGNENFEIHKLKNDENNIQIQETKEKNEYEYENENENENENEIENKSLSVINSNNDNTNTNSFFNINSKKNNKYIKFLGFHRF